MFVVDCLFVATLKNESRIEVERESAYLCERLSIFYLVKRAKEKEYKRPLFAVRNDLSGVKDLVNFR